MSIQPLKRFRVPLRITGTAFVMATSARAAHAQVHKKLGGTIIAYDGEWRAGGAFGGPVVLGRALVVYGPEGVNTIVPAEEKGS